MGLSNDEISPSLIVDEDIDECAGLC